LCSDRNCAAEKEPFSAPVYYEQKVRLFIRAEGQPIVGSQQVLKKGSFLAALAVSLPFPKSNILGCPSCQCLVPVALQTTNLIIHRDEC
jgi:hypothetical protein